MCGITGIAAFNKYGKAHMSRLAAAVEALSARGPDDRGEYRHDSVALGHTRLSVIDTSTASSQPFTDDTGRYTIVFNGEFYNFKDHRPALEKKGFRFRSSGDTETLLYLYMDEGISCLEKINGCFAFAIYDKEDESLFLVRDRMGINPLLYYLDENKLIFGSEMKALIAFGIPRQLDETSLYNYLQFNYIPGPHSILKNVFKLLPGSWLSVKKGKIERGVYYRIPECFGLEAEISYEAAQRKLETLLSQAVERRLISDVPLGAFLSGGIDSSVVVALASGFSKNLNTFSIGYKDEPFFDETYYARLVAEKFKTNHTVFSLTNDDLFDNLFKVLDYTDEPFADSSALAVHILSMHTRKTATVALSGDGADETFAGYNKHMAHYRSRYPGYTAKLVKAGAPLWKNLHQSRDSKLSNVARQLNRFAVGMKMNEKERYWRWCGFSGEKDVSGIFGSGCSEEYISRKEEILKHIGNHRDMNDILYTDMHLVLQNDMLLKVDLMSMANSLEVRTPFLDHTVTDFVFSLPSSYKIDRSRRKKLLQDTFRNVLPAELYDRPKKGFEVPLLKWLRSGLKPLVTDDLLNDDFVKEQNLFDLSGIQNLKKKLYSSNPEDIHAQIWGLLVFQYWWKKYFV